MKSIEFIRNIITSYKKYFYHSLRSGKSGFNTFQLETAVEFLCNYRYGTKKFTDEISGIKFASPGVVISPKIAYGSIGDTTGSN